MTQKPTTMATGLRGLRGLWGFVLLILAGLAVTCLLVLTGVGTGARPAFLDRAPPSAPPRPGDSRSPHHLSLAGSGSNLPLTRRLARAFRAKRPTLQVIVHESIGSGGGIRATRDRVIDLGLISRPVKPAERTAGLQVIPYARVAVVLAANPGVKPRPFTSRQLEALYAGKQSRWPDGHRAMVIQREQGDSSHQAVNRVLPSFAAINATARRHHRFRVVLQDSAMQEALLATDGAVGLLDLGTIVSQSLPLTVLTIDGRRPTREDPLPTGYPFYKDLAFVSVQRPSKEAQAFIRFVLSEAGRAIVRRSGYLPLGKATP